MMTARIGGGLLAVAIALGTIGLVPAAQAQPGVADPSNLADRGSTRPGPVAGAQGRALRPFPEQPGCVPWPTDRWRRGRLPTDVARSDVNELVNRFRQVGGRAIVIVQGGRLVYEWYRDGITPNTVNASFSVSKSITGTVAGLLHRDGVIPDVEAPAPVPEWQSPGDPRAAITWHHLMNMRPGLKWTESYDFLEPGNDIIDSISSGDAGGWVASQPLVATPGSQLNYSTGTTNLLARTMGQVLGRTGPAMEAEVNRLLFDPLGIESAQMGFDESGHWLGGYSTNMTTRDFARYGLFHLRGGAWDDAQLLPENWIHRVGADGHATQFWAAPRDRFSAVGIRGQWVSVAKDLDLVIAGNSDSGRVHEDVFERLFAWAGRSPCGREVRVHRPVNDPARRFPAGEPITVRFSVDGGPSSYGTRATVSSRRAHCKSARSTREDLPVAGRVRQRADGRYRVVWPTRASWRGCRELRIALPDGTVSSTRVRFVAPD